MKNSFRILFSLFIIGCLIGVWIKFGSLFLADYYSQKAEDALEKGEYTSSLKYSTQAIALNPKEESYYRRRAKVSLIFSAKEDVLMDINTAIELNPKNLATLRNVIPLMYYLSLQNPMAQNSSEELVDLEYFPKAVEFYRYMFHIYPNDAGILVSLAYYQGKLGLDEDLDQTLQRIRILRPDLLEWHPLLVN